MKISWIGPWVNRIDWCEGHWFGSTYMAMRLSEISSKTGKKCIFCDFRLFLPLPQTTSQAYIYFELHQCPSHQSILLTQGRIPEIFTKFFWELAILKNSGFLSQPFFKKKNHNFSCFLAMRNCTTFYSVRNYLRISAIYFAHIVSCQFLYIMIYLNWKKNKKIKQLKTKNQNLVTHQWMLITRCQK